MFCQEILKLMIVTRNLLALNYFVQGLAVVEIISKNADQTVFHSIYGAKA